MSFFCGESSDYSRMKCATPADHKDPYRYNKENTHNPTRHTATRESHVIAPKPIEQRVHFNQMESYNKRVDTKVDVRVNPNFTESNNKPLPKAPELRVNPNNTESGRVAPKKTETRITGLFTETYNEPVKLPETRVTKNNQESYNEPISDKISVRSSKNNLESYNEPLKRASTARENPNMRSSVFAKDDTNIKVKSKTQPRWMSSSINFGDEKTVYASTKELPKHRKALSEIPMEKMSVAGRKKESYKDPKMLNAFKKKADPTKYDNQNDDFFNQKLDHVMVQNTKVKKPITAQNQKSRVVFKDNLDNEPPKRTLKRAQSEKVIVDPEWSQKYHTRNDVNLSSNYHLVTFNVEGVSENLKLQDMERDLQSKGLNVYDTTFNQNPVSNKRDGTGVMHARAKTKEEVEKIKKELGESGLSVTVAQKYKPTWRN